MKSIFLILLSLSSILIFSTGCFPQSGPYYKGLAAGGAFGCALDSKIDGIVCWGDNSAGQTSVPILYQPTAIAGVFVS